MQFSSPLKSAQLIKRYKRFLADVRTPEGEILTLYCPNTGAMTGCATPGDTVWYSASDNLKRKYRHTWELTQTQQHHWICVNTLRANTLASEAITQGIVPELAGYAHLEHEVKYGHENSRIDLLLSSPDEPFCYVEVKSVTLLESGQGFFPDAVTERGQKHLRELTAMVESGARAVLFYAVLHTGIDDVSAAAHIDPHYAALLAQACSKGVEVICYKAEISPQGMAFVKKIPFIE